MADDLEKEPEIPRIEDNSSAPRPSVDWSLESNQAIAHQNQSRENPTAASMLNNGFSISGLEKEPAANPKYKAHGESSTEFYENGQVKKQSSYRADGTRDSETKFRPDGSKEMTRKFSSDGYTRESETYFDKDGKAKESLRFDENGSGPLAKTEFDKNGQPSRTVEFSEKDRNKVSSVSSFENGKAVSKDIYAEDGKSIKETQTLGPDGKAVSKIEWGPNGAMKSKTVYEYSADGSKAQETKFNAANEKESQTKFDKDGKTKSETGFAWDPVEARTVAVTETKFDKDGSTESTLGKGGRVTGESRFDKEGRKVSESLFGSDSKPYLTIEFEKDGKTPALKREFNGDKVSESRYEGGKLKSRSELDGNGQKLSEAKFADGTQVSVSKFQYENGKLVSALNYEGYRNIPSTETRFAADGKTPLEIRAFAEDGKTVKSLTKLDSDGKTPVTKEEFENGHLKRSSSYESGVKKSETDYKYDEQSKTTFKDKERVYVGKVMSETQYASDGRTALSRSTYDRDGKAVLVQGPEKLLSAADLKKMEAAAYPKMDQAAGHKQFQDIARSVFEKITRTNSYEDTAHTGVAKGAAAALFMAANPITGPSYWKANYDAKFGDGIRNKLQEPFKLKIAEEGKVNILSIGPEDWKNAHQKLEAERSALGLGPTFGNCRTLSAEFCHQALEKIQNDPALKDCKVRWAWSQEHSWAEVLYPDGKIGVYDPWKGGKSAAPVKEADLPSVTGENQRPGSNRLAQSQWFGVGGAYKKTRN
ncbi:MAG: hypothetical protein K2X27_19245 [Candidatus Obscuribacterales bacterium]|nr:hypothetical protein [Candidatus Obscuribacterales bacterium]